MDRLPGFEQPYGPLPTSYRVRATAGATHQATGDLWEPQNAHLSRNLKGIQARIMGFASGSDLEIYRHSRLRTQTPVDLMEWASNRLSLTDRRRVDAPSSTPFCTITMDRLSGFERPYESLPASYRASANAGTTQRATGVHWEPQNAHLS